MLRCVEDQDELHACFRSGLPRAFAVLLRHSEVGGGYAGGGPAARAHSAFKRCRENLRALTRYGGRPHPEVVLRGNWATGVKYQPQGVESSVAFSQVVYHYAVGQDGARSLEISSRG